MRCRLAIVLVLGAVLATPTHAAAQTNGNGEKLNLLVPGLILSNLAVDEVILRLALLNFGIFDPQQASVAIQAGQDLSKTLNGAIATQLTSFPIGSSAGGFSWTFDPALGTFSRVSSSFGSSFVDRGLTVGRRKFNFGVTYQRVTFDKLEGRDLRDGEIKLYVGRTCQQLGLRCNQADDAVFIEESLDLKLSASTLGLFASYGVTDRLDLGIAVPVVAVELDAALTTRLGTRSEDLIPDPDPFTDRRSGDASGIGDVVIRAKYNFWRRGSAGMAAGVDWRLPSGDEEDLLGVPGPQGKFYLAASGEHGRMAPHLNIGFTISGDTEAARSPETFLFAPPDEFNLSGGMDFAATPRLTITGDLIGRTLFNEGRLSWVSSPFRRGFQQIDVLDGNLNVVLGAVSVKYNAFGKALLAGNILLPVNASGMYDKMAWALGFEYSF